MNENQFRIFMSEFVKIRLALQTLVNLQVKKEKENE